MLDAPTEFPSGSTLGFAGSNATALARLQAKGCPWMCGKIKASVTNGECASRKLDAVQEGNRRSPCHDCSKPLAMGWKPNSQEGQVMAKGDCQCCDAKDVTTYKKAEVIRCYQCHKVLAPPVSAEVAKAEPATIAPVIPVSDEVAEPPKITSSDLEDKMTHTPSWDDFAPVVAVRPLNLIVGVQAGDRLSLSVDIVAGLSWTKGQTVEVRVSSDKQALALRLSGEYRRGFNNTLTAGSKSASLSVNCGEVLRVLGTASGKYNAEIVPWGLIVRLDRPVGA